METSEIRAETENHHTFVREFKQEDGPFLAARCMGSIPRFEHLLEQVDDDYDVINLLRTGARLHTEKRGQHIRFYLDAANQPTLDETLAVLLSGGQDLLLVFDYEHEHEDAGSSFAREEADVRVERRVYGTHSIRSIRELDQSTDWEDWVLSLRRQLPSLDDAELASMVQGLQITLDDSYSEAERPLRAFEQQKLLSYLDSIGKLAVVRQWSVDSLDHGAIDPDPELSYFRNDLHVDDHRAVIAAIDVSD